MSFTRHLIKPTGLFPDMLFWMRTSWRNWVSMLSIVKLNKNIQTVIIWLPCMHMKHANKIFKLDSKRKNHSKFLCASQIYCDFCALFLRPSLQTWSHVVAFGHLVTCNCHFHVFTPGSLRRKDRSSNATNHTCTYCSRERERERGGASFGFGARACATN